MRQVQLILYISIIFVLSNNQIFAEPSDSFKKNRIKQLSEHNERYNFYKEKNDRVKDGSKKIGIKADDIKGYGKIHNWVEIENSKVGNIWTSGAKRLKSFNPFRDSNKKNEPDRNLGVITDNKRSVDNTVIIKRSKVEDGLIGGEVNSGIQIKSKRNITNKKYENKVIIEESRLGGAASLLGGN